MTQATSWIVFRSLLASKEDKTLPSYLSEQLQRQLSHSLSLSHSAFAQTSTERAYVNECHYSWLIPLCQVLREEDLLMVLSALDPFQREKLKHYLQITKNAPDLSALAREFLLDEFDKRLIQGEVNWLPIQFVPDHPLKSLLDLKKKEIQTLIDFLGLHDLAIDLRQMIESKKIKKVLALCSRAERQYLKTLMQKKERAFFARLNLDAWDGNEETLKHILHHRGVNRLGKALFGCHPSLVLHLCYRLDTGRAKILRKFCSNINNELAQKTLVDQVIELIPVVKQDNV